MLILGRNTQNDRVEKAEDFIRWLGPSYSEVEEQLDVIQKDQKRNTLPWALNMREFKNRRTSAAGSKENLLWIRGPPLVGKSTAAAMFIDGLKHAYPSSLVVYFICKRLKRSLRTTRNIICMYVRVPSGLS